MYLKWKNERRYVIYADVFWHYFVKEGDILIDLKEGRENEKKKRKIVEKKKEDKIKQTGKGNEK